MKQRINIVVDIETLSLSTEAAILSIAAVPFNPNGGPFEGGQCLVEKEGDLFLHDVAELEPFYEVINATSCALQGMHIDMNTVNWWAGQSEEAKAELLSREPMRIGEAMNAFHNYLVGMQNAYDAEIIVWAQGSDFDFPVLKNAYRRVMKDAELPWKYWQQRDARTFILTRLEEHFGIESKPYERIPSMPVPEGWVRHSALSDARHTAWSIAYVNSLCRSSSEAVTSD